MAKTNKQRCAGFLGICRKAAKLEAGHDAVVGTIVSGKAKLVILSSDASERLENEINHASAYGGKNIPVIRCGMTMMDFAACTGKKSAVFSVTEKGFADKLNMLFGEE